ncbi:phosphotransferase [Paenibacillus sp. KN14-4R]|uniref:phosphotransferase n=1 Tax=Paenibacillus sp. KN14-4R TaxID=3445773 RepID=UPI003FA17EB9
MSNAIKSINWIDYNDKLDDLLRDADTLTVHPMTQGFEAEVKKVCSHDESFVMKIWNKASKPNIQFQYHLLSTLVDCGLSVSKPLGWGKNAEGNEVLLTTFDGNPISKINKKKITDMAHILSKIHHISLEDVQHLQLPKHDFIDYFYPEIEQHSDLQKVAEHLVELAKLRQDRVIHGDYHMYNVLESGDQYAVIDWTNAQLGDTRYDFAWTYILIHIYVAERNANLFRSAYVLDHPMEQEELDLFIAIACVRWMLLNRSGGVPQGAKAMKQAQMLIEANPYLKEVKLIEN